MSMTADGLRALECFQSLPQSAAAALARNGRLRSYTAREALFREGDAASGIFIVLAGEVRVVRASRGRRHVFHTERRGGTQESLAEELGTVREVVMRALRSLRERHIIRSAGRSKIEIVDRSALRALTAE